MKILTFTGSTPSEALKKAKSEIGDNGLLIETRELKKRALGRAGLYEIIIGIEEKDIKPLKQEDSKRLIQESEDVLFDISNAAKQISKVSKVSSIPVEYTMNQEKQIKEKREFIPSPLLTSAPIVQTESVEPLELKEIKSEIGKLTDKMKLIQHMFWEEKKPETEDVIPAEFAEIYKLASQSGMNQEHLDALMKMTLEHMPLKMRENSETVKRYFQTLLRKIIPIRLEHKLSLGRKKVIMLVGPTGVGKTTSVAKLAARYSFLMEQKYKVGLIVLDTYRIGAVEQLMQYARMMRLGIETVSDSSEFTSALNALAYCDYILIDTMGSSPYDKTKIEAIYSCLDANNTNLEIEVVLVLSSSIKYEDLKATYDNFESLDIDTIMFSKLDETVGFGNIFSLAYETRKPISYFSIGQEVPEDLICASSEFLVDCLLNGFNRSKIQ